MDSVPRLETGGPATLVSNVCEKLVVVLALHPYHAIPLHFGIVGVDRDEAHRNTDSPTRRVVGARGVGQGDVVPEHLTGLQGKVQQRAVMLDPRGVFDRGIGLSYVVRRQISKQNRGLNPNQQ